VEQPPTDYPALYYRIFFILDPQDDISKLWKFSNSKKSEKALKESPPQRAKHAKDKRLWKKFFTSSFTL